MGRLQEKVAIVTGAGSGIGKAIARSLAGEGAKLVIVGRTVEKLQNTAEDIRSLGGTAVALPADITDGSPATDSTSSTHTAT